MRGLIDKARIPPMLVRASRRWALPAVVAAVAAALAGIGSATASGAADGATCPPVSAAQLHSILGYSNSLQARNTTDDSGRAVRYLCNGVAWSGPTPTSRQAVYQTARSGHGAAFGIEAWQPNDSSEDVQRWKDEDFPKLRSRLLEGYASFPGLFTNAGWPTKRFDPSGVGHAAVGVVVTVGSGPAKGLVAAVGCWWDSDAYTAVCLLVEEAVGKPVVTHLNQLAKIAVPKVL